MVRYPAYFGAVAEPTMKSLYHCQYLSIHADDVVYLVARVCTYTFFLFYYKIVAYSWYNANETCSTL